MANIAQIDEIFRNILGNENVYFQPPPSLLMHYPAIRYRLADIQNTFADNKVYIQTRAYEVTVIDPNPDSEIVESVSKLPTCKFNRYYAADNLNHTVFLIHF